MPHNKMDVAEYINEIVLAGSGIAASLVAWKQGQKTAKTSHLDNVEKAIEIWENTSIKLQDKLTNLETEITSLKKNHEDCEESKRVLSEKVNQLENTMHNMIGTPDRLRPKKGK
jgi:predicted RNase H-like nuclease (RuvC/YqgF family)